MLVIALKLGHFFQMIPNVSELVIVMVAAYLLLKHNVKIILTVGVVTFSTFHCFKG